MVRLSDAGDELRQRCYGRLNAVPDVEKRG